MRICIDLTSLADNLSGIERYAACLSLEMIKNNDCHFILVFKNDIHPMFGEFMGKTNIECIVIPGYNKLLFNQIRLPLVLHRIKADCFLFLAFPVPIFTCKRYMVSTIHDICCWDCPETMNRSMKWYFRVSHRIAIKKCKRIITISDFSRKRINEKLRYPINNIWLIYCGVDSKFLNYKRDKENDISILEKYKLPDKYVLSLSTLEPRKNLRLLIKAYRNLILSNKTNIPLVLAGRKGWKMDALLNGIEKKIVDKIIFTGFIDDEDLPVIYGNASCFVFSSMYEGFGMPPLEAYACGSRVVSSDATSLPEVLGDGAIYFKNNNQSDLEKVLDNVLQSDEQNLKQIVISYRWENEANKLLGELKCGLNEK